MILVLNCGSQTIKWKIFDSSLKQQKEGRVFISRKESYEKSLIGEFKKIKEFGKEIAIIGHRFVHGGSVFSKPIIIKKDNLKKLEGLNALAPLHNHFNLLGIKFSQSVFPEVKQFVFFDTEFYSSLPQKAIICPLPENIRTKYGIRKFGFHGISHEYTAKEAARIVGKSLKDLKIITCHLGGGSSITAIDSGKAVETSMGFTPLDGLVMMTRAGAIDPGIVLFLKDKVKNLENILNYESGLKGICGLSDMKEILEEIKKGTAGKKIETKLALDVFVYSIQKYIGSYYAILGGCDLLVFTGAIGAGSAKIVNFICKDLKILASTKILSVKANEELAIAQKIKNIIKI